MSNEKQETTYLSFNGLDRQALYFGVPLVPFVMILIVAVMLSMVSLFFLGLIGLLVFLIVVPLIVFLRGITEKDDNALHILAIEMKLSFLKRNTELFGNSLTFIPNSKDDLNASITQQYFENPSNR